MHVLKRYILFINRLNPLEKNHRKAIQVFHFHPDPPQYPLPILVFVALVRI
jgi:hypothetical protein